MSPPRRRGRQLKTDYVWALKDINLEIMPGEVLGIIGKNGAILGMTKTEIRSKLDEIIDFSGCERYIETPVKHYSQGF